MTKQTVYNTGKVLIGLHYRPVQKMEQSADMAKLQTALLKLKKPFQFTKGVKGVT